MRKRTVTLGKLNASVSPGDPKRVQIKLSRRGSRLFASAGRMRVTMTIELAVSGGQTTTLKRTQRLTAPKRR